jgi:hypothetical protein
MQTTTRLLQLGHFYFPFTRLLQLLLKYNFYGKQYLNSLKNNL